MKMVSWLPIRRYDFTHSVFSRLRMREAGPEVGRILAARCAVATQENLSTSLRAEHRSLAAA